MYIAHPYFELLTLPSAGITGMCRHTQQLFRAGQVFLLLYFILPLSLSASLPPFPFLLTLNFYFRLICFETRVHFRALYVVLTDLELRVFPTASASHVLRL